MLGTQVTTSNGAVIITDAETGRVAKNIAAADEQYVPFIEISTGLEAHEYILVRPAEVVTVAPIELAAASDPTPEVPEA